MDAASSIESPVAEPYQHVPLDLSPGSIRLIEVVCSETENGCSNTIHCKTRHASVHANYACLSYVWGSSTPLHVIMLGGKPFTVRRNLWDFLNMASSQI